MIKAKLITLLLIALSTSVIGQDSYPQTLEQNQYVVKTRGASAKIIRIIEQLDAKTFKASSVAKHALVSVKEYCTFTEDEQGNIVPLEYNYRIKSFFGGRKQHIVFDWEAMKATATYKKKTIEIDLKPGYQTDLTMQLQMQRDLAKGLKAFDYTIVRKLTTRDSHFEIVESELVDDTADTNLVQLQQRKSARKEVNIWVDSENKYKLSRMRITSKKDGNVSIDFVKNLL